LCGFFVFYQYFTNLWKSLDNDTTLVNFSQHIIIVE